MTVAFVGNEAEIQRVFAKGRRAEIEAMATCLPGVRCPNDPRLSEVEAIFSTWGMPRLTAEQLDQVPNLRVVFYAAGAVGSFASPLVERGIAISSAWLANAIPVAEFTLAQILLACKGYFRNVREFHDHPDRGPECHRGLGILGESIALLGAGGIGSKLIELLQPFQLEVLVFDPYLTLERAEELGVERVTLDEAFRRGYVVSNHLLDVPDTYGLIGRIQLKSMRANATFINTGRGRTVQTEALVETLRNRPDLTALLDVTDPEPLPPSHPLRYLPNAHVSSHIAGSIGDEVVRMADYAIEEFERYLRQEPLKYRVYE